MEGRIIKAKVKADFVQVRNIVAQNNKISWQALGLLTYLLSLPEDWILYKTQLYKLRKANGRTSTDTAFSELEKSGFIKSIEKRSKVGHFKGFDYIVYHEPNAENLQSDVDFPQSGFPQSDNQHLQRNIVQQKNNETNNAKPNGSLFLENEIVVDGLKDKKEKSSAKKERSVDPAFNVLKETFVDWYKKEIELDYMFAGAKDGVALKGLCIKFRHVLKEKHGAEITEEIIKDAFEYMLNNLPKWDKENVTLSLLNSRFNVILSQLKSKGKKHASGISAEQAWYISL